MQKITLILNPLVIECWHPRKATSMRNPTTGMKNLDVNICNFHVVSVDTRRESWTVAMTHEHQVRSLETNRSMSHIKAWKTEPNQKHEGLKRNAWEGWFKFRSWVLDGCSWNLLMDGACAQICNEELQLSILRSVKGLKIVQCRVL